MAGDYHEQVNINKTLLVAGAGADVTRIIGDSTSTNNTTVRMNTVNGATLQGFTVTRDGLEDAVAYKANKQNYAVFVSGTGNVVQNNIFEDNRWGVMLQNTVDAKVLNNILRRNHAGIYAYNRNNGTLIEGNHIVSNWAHGIEFRDDNQQFDSAGIIVRE